MSGHDFSNAQRGPVIKQKGKTRITLWLDDDILDRFRTQATEEGQGYQTLINAALRRATNTATAPVTLDDLRRVLREELHVA